MQTYYNEMWMADLCYSCVYYVGAFIYYALFNLSISLNDAKSRSKLSVTM